jgi:hypothetical protein
METRASDSPGIRLLDRAEHRRWRALLARIEGRQEDEARYDAEAERYDQEALALLEKEFADSTSPEPPTNNRHERNKDS